MRILITGSEGRIGQHMRQRLEAEHELTLLDMRESKGSRHRFVHGDLVDSDTCKRAVEGVEAIVHLAAALHPGVPHAYVRNTTGTWNLMSAAAEAGVKRVAFASTINVYGQGIYKISQRVYKPAYLPIDENIPPRPEDSYALSKVACEQMMQGFSDGYGMAAYCFRLSGVWNPEWTDKYVPHPHAWALSPTRFIDPWTYVDMRDLVDAFRRFVEMPNPPAFGVSYLVADDTTRPEPTMELFQKYLPEWIPLVGDRLPGHRVWFSNERVKRDLVWRPEHMWRRA
jgi:nucleoside-diphosphate-sugar epimerase